MKIRLFADTSAHVGVYEQPEYEAYNNMLDTQSALSITHRPL